LSTEHLPELFRLGRVHEIREIEAELGQDLIQAAPFDDPELLGAGAQASDKTLGYIPAEIRDSSLEIGKVRDGHRQHPSFGDTVAEVARQLLDGVLEILCLDLRWKLEERKSRNAKEREHNGTPMPHVFESPLKCVV
jgi:hypothetical protein